MRRSAMLLSVLLILASLAAIHPATQTPHQEGGILGHGPAPFAASGDASLDVIITDDQGLPILGSSIEVFDGWTDIRVAGPIVVAGSRLVIDELPAGPMRIHATHTPYASAFSTISLTSGVTNTTISLIPLDATLQVSTDAVATLTP